MDPGPPPGPGWTLGDDGHWKPPPFEIGGPQLPPRPAPPPGPPPPPPGPWQQQPPAGPQPAPPGAAPPTWPPQGAPKRTNPGLVVAGVVGGLAVLVALLLAAVTMLGTNQEDDAGPESRFPGTLTPRDDRTTTTDTEPEEEDDEDTDPAEPGDQPEITEAVLASQRVSEYVAGDEWTLAGAEELPLESTEYCSPPGWNSGATSRFQTMYDHVADGEADGQVEINVTVYGSPEDTAADAERAGSPEWHDCQRRRIAAATGDTNPTIQQAPNDPLASGETYVMTYREDGEPVMEIIQYVFVGQIRATISYCGCTTVDLEGRQQVARDVAAALAEVQGVTRPGAG